MSEIASAPDTRSSVTATRQARTQANQATPELKNGGKAIIADQALKTDWSYLGFASATADGFTVRFGIEQQFYVLKTTAPNYNAMCSTLLASWLEGAKLSLEYRRPLSTIDPNAPMIIEGVHAMRPGSDGN